jgi:hypothetical protein
MLTDACDAPRRPGTATEERTMSESSTGHPSAGDPAAQINGATDTSTEAPAGDAPGGAQAGAEGHATGSARHDIFAKLADAGEEVISRVAGMPGAAKALEQAQTALGRLDDVQKRLLGVEALEKRVVELEARVAELEQRAGGTGAAAPGSSQL